MILWIIKHIWPSHTVRFNTTSSSSPRTHAFALIYQWLVQKYSHNTVLQCYLQLHWPHPSGGNGQMKHSNSRMQLAITIFLYNKHNARTGSEFYSLAYLPQDKFIRLTMSNRRLNISCPQNCRYQQAYGINCTCNYDIHLVIW